MAGTDVNEIYDRLQERIDLDEMTDGAIEELLVTNFTQHKTQSGRVDLTSNHYITEWRDASHEGKPRRRLVQGFTPNLNGLIDKIKNRRNADIDVKLKEVTKPFYRKIASVEAGDFDGLYGELDEREMEIEKWREVKGDNDTDDLILEHVETYRQELQRLEEEIADQEKLEMLEEIEEERKERAAKAYRKSKR